MNQTLGCACGHTAAEHGLDGTCMIIGCGCPQSGLQQDGQGGLDLDVEGCKLSEPTCSMCGCTEAEPCEGGCSWVMLDPETNLGVCSACADVA